MEFPPQERVEVEEYYQRGHEAMIPDCFDYSLFINVHLADLRKSRFLIIADGCLPLQHNLKYIFHSDISFIAYPGAKQEHMSALAYTIFDILKAEGVQF